MRRLLRRGLAATAATVACIAAAPAVAADEVLSINPAGSQEFPERAYRLQVPDRIALDSAAVTLSENGEAVGGVAVESATSGAADSFATVLVIDASESMEGRPIAEAMRAARAFAQQRAPGQRLGVVTFNSEAKLLLPLTADEARIDAALSSTPGLGSSTHLYDATDLALDKLRDADVAAGSVVILSDGADTGSETALSDLVAAADDSGIRVFAVGLRSEVFDPGTLEDLAVGGTVADAATPEDLAPILERVGAGLASEYLLAYRSEAKPGEGVTVEVQVDGISGVARDYYDIPAPAEASPADAGPTGPAPLESEGFWGSPAAMLGAISLAAGLLGVASFSLLRPRPRSLRDRLARFVDSYGVGVADRPASTPPDQGVERGATNPLAPIERTLEGRRWWARFNEELEVARIEVPALRIVVATVAATVLAAFVFGSAVGSALVPLALLVPFGVRLWIRRELRVLREQFADQLADSLQLVASALRAGQSMVGALAIVVDETPEPARAEFRRVVTDESLGTPLEEAIRGVARRMDNRDLEQVALVATIQRETGGNTAEILDQVIETIRDRGKLRRMMRTLTAQGRLSQIIISALPLALLVWIMTVNPDYVDPLFSTGAGRLALAFGAGLSIIGSVVIKRIVEIKV
jgi:tight adherence protein B